MWQTCFQEFLFAPIIKVSSLLLTDLRSNNRQFSLSTMPLLSQGYARKSDTIMPPPVLKSPRQHSGMKGMCADQSLEFIGQPDDLTPLLQAPLSNEPILIDDSADFTADCSSSPPLPQMYSPDTSATNTPLRGDTSATCMPLRGDTSATFMPLRGDTSATNTPLRGDTSATCMPLIGDTSGHLTPLRKRQKLSCTPKMKLQLTDISATILPPMPHFPPADTSGRATHEMVQVTNEWYLATESICGMLTGVSELELSRVPGLDGARLVALLARRTQVEPCRATPATPPPVPLAFNDSMDSLEFIFCSEQLDEVDESAETQYEPLHTSTQRATHPATNETTSEYGADVSPIVTRTAPATRATSGFQPPFSAAPSSSRGGAIVSRDTGQGVPATDDVSAFRGQYPHSHRMRTEFARTFGLNYFRPKQEEAINAVMLGHDAFILMPTGGGKSLIYQIPAILSPGVTIVISPLRSLILDQVQRLNVLQVQAAHLSGDQTPTEEASVYFQLSKQTPIYKLVYLTPEKLTCSGRLKTVLRQLHSRGLLDRVVIDEAHCISQWGHDFRPDYKRLSELKDTFKGIQILALTATATKGVRFDVARVLKLNDTKWFVGSCNRSNLKYEIRRKRPSTACQEILELIRTDFHGQSGIVYCLSRKDCEQVSEALLGGGVSSAPYHAGMGDSNRTDVQKRWLSQFYKVICATIAFGMGIDKPDVRFVIHHSMPKSLEGYYQESGRAGRDGQESTCVIFYSYSDATRLKSLITREAREKRHDPRSHLDNIHMMVSFCENMADCRRVLMLSYLGEEFSAQECNETCDNCRDQSAAEVVERDMTQETQNIILSVRLLSHVNLTLIQLSEIFRGCQGQKIIQSNYNTLPMFNRSEGLSRTDIDRYLHMLLITGILTEETKIGLHDRVFNYVRIGHEAEKVLKESKRVMFRCSLATKSKQRNAVAEASSQQSAVYPNFHDCLDELKTLRLRVAEECDISPENIYNVATLREMSYSPPDTRTTFLAVTGVTESKWNKFSGEAFLEVTNKFCVLKRQFLTAQADTLVPHSATQPLPVSRHTRGFNSKSKYFNGANKAGKGKFAKNWRAKSGRSYKGSADSGVKTVSYSGAGSGSGSGTGTTRLLAPPLPRGRK